MYEPSVLANLIGRSLDSIASITCTGDGIRVTTQCMYPSNGLVQVTVRGGVETIVASDEGGAVGEALSAGISLKDYNRTLAHLIRDQGLSISDGVIFTPRIQIEAVSAAIIQVANASQDIARLLYERRLQEASDLLGAQDDRQLARLVDERQMPSRAAR
jgi:hypothetical protein